MVSYFLVCYYFAPVASLSAKITVASNRVGDLLVMLILAVWVLSCAGLGWLVPGPAGLIFGALVVFARLTKRAQGPFRAWLPAAMRAPTPVSSLVHSSTLVTAGVFLVLRLLDSVPLAFRGLLFGVACVTLITATLLALLTLDLKALVAYSTLSQLSLMFIAVVAGRPGLA